MKKQLLVLLIAFFGLTHYNYCQTKDDFSSKLPEKTNQKPEGIFEGKNVLQIDMNLHNQMMIGNGMATVNDVKKLVMEFIDNGGGYGFSKNGKPGEPCDYCNGMRDPNSSDHPTKAAILLQSDGSTKDEMYISVQNAIEQAYDELRNKLSVRIYGRSLDKMEVDYINNPTESLKVKINNIKEKYPKYIVVKVLNMKKT